MTKAYHFALLCVLSLQLCSIIRTQDWNYENWENEECSWEEEHAWSEEECVWGEEEYILGTSGKQAASCQQQYTIQAGDICANIATANGITVQNIQDWNPGLDCSLLQIGSQICVKGGDNNGGGDNGGGNNGGGDNGGDNSGGDLSVSFDQFKAAVTATNGYPEPTEDQYNSFINNYKDGNISSLRELAMFLSEIIWESGGLQFKEEIACKDTKCPDQYRSEGDDPNKFYYGRGYIQLSWSYNYKAASEALYQDDRLVTDPDQVATDENVAWQTAFWFWKANVHDAQGVQDGQFGSATNAINGALECNPCQGNCPKRNEIYAAVLQAFGVNEQPNTAGC